MTDPIRRLNSEDITKTVSRRYLLRNSAIAGAGVALLPSFLTGCRKNIWDYIPGHGGGGLGEDPPLTDAELFNASQNLKNMFHWIEDLYPFCIEYEIIVFAMLQSGDKGPGAWKDFILDIFSEIAVGILEGAADEIPGAGAAIAAAGDQIKDWVSDNVPPTLKSAYIEFADGHLRMQKAITDQLAILADKGKTDDPGYPYQNLKEAFKEDITFNGKTYSLKQLANSTFPTLDQGEDYVALRTAAYDKFRQHIWNVMLIKTGTMEYSSDWHTECGAFAGLPNRDAMSPSRYAAEVHYKDPRYIATYLRGHWANDVYRFRYWYFEVDGRELSAEAVKELFKDDYPGHIINPEGLFFRDYVFKQFHREKPEFVDPYNMPFHELLSTADDPYCSDAKDFNHDADNYVFTGGDIPAAIKK